MGRFTPLAPGLSYCPKCNEDMPLRPCVEKFTITMAGKEITSDVHMLRCPRCQSQYPDRKYEPMDGFFNREKHTSD